MQRNIARVVALGWLAALAGCGVYGFSSSLLPAHIKTVGVPLMENTTDRRDLATALADSLVNAFIDDNTLKVASERDADAVIERYPGAQTRNFDGQPQVTEMDALIAYLQVLGTMVDFETFTPVASR